MSTTEYVAKILKRFHDERTRGELIGARIIKEEMLLDDNYPVLEIIAEVRRLDGEYQPTWNYQKWSFRIHPVYQLPAVAYAEDLDGNIHFKGREPLLIYNVDTDSDSEDDISILTQETPITPTEVGTFEIEREAMDLLEQQPLFAILSPVQMNAFEAGFKAGIEAGKRLREEAATTQSIRRRIIDDLEDW